MRANFVHPPFARKLSEVGRWRRTLYADLHDADLLSAWKEYVDYPLELTKGKGAVRAWLNLDQSRVRDFTADLQLTDLSMAATQRFAAVGAGACQRPHFCA